MIFQLILLFVALVAGFVYIGLTQGWAAAFGLLALVCFALLYLSLV